MNTLTISQAMLKIAELEKTYRNKLRIISDISSTTTSYILELDNSKHKCSEPFDFDKEFNTILELSKEIEVLRNAISKANNTALIEVEGSSITIQAALNKLKMYRNQLDTFEVVLEYSKASKTRKVDAAGTQPYYKVTELTFNKEELQSFIDKLSATILDIELSINEANNKTVITLA